MSDDVTVAVTLSAQHPDVKLAGTIDAYGLGGVYGGATIYALH